VVVLGSSTFVPFMQLRAADRRSVIEDLLDIQIFTVMNSLLKERISENKELIISMKYQIDLLENKIEAAQAHNESIRQIKETEVSRLKEKLKEQITLIEGEQEAVQTLMEDVKTLTEGIDDKAKMKKNLAELEKIDGQLSNKLSKLQKDIDFYEHHDNCPTCKQGIKHDFKEETTRASKDKISEIEEAKVELSSRLDRVEDRLKDIDEVETSIAAKNLEMSEHNANYKMAMNICKQIKTDLENAEKEVEEIDSEEIDKLNKDLNTKHKEQQSAFDDKETFGTIAAMLRDGGIKTRIVKQYVPIMNKLINKYLAAMDFFVQFELDENFNETIKSRFRDVFSYSSFSEGEKLRIDLALLFTWRAVSKLRNSVSTNLLIMDEIMDSSLDNSGTEEFLKIINEITADSNVFIISHKGDQLVDKFDTTLRFDKVKNFSKMSVV
jgi:DNA repair exonuclease SbcCD ATPase subunit